MMKILAGILISLFVVIFCGSCADNGVNKEPTVTHIKLSPIKDVNREIDTPMKEAIERVQSELGEKNLEKKLSELEPEKIAIVSKELMAELKYLRKANCVSDSLRRPDCEAKAIECVSDISEEKEASQDEMRKYSQFLTKTAINGERALKCMEIFRSTAANVGKLTCDADRKEASRLFSAEAENCARELLMGAGVPN